MNKSSNKTIDKKNKPVKSIIPEKELTEEEKQAKDFINNKSKTYPKIIIETEDDKTFKFTADFSKNPINLKRIFEALGTFNIGLMTKYINQIVNVSSGADKQANINNALVMLYDIKPKDSLECMLILQMIGAHNLAMDFMSRAIRSDGSGESVTHTIQSNVDRATKLMRTITAQIEALDRHRNKGKQIMTIKHINVNQGGKAVIGNIQNPEKPPEGEGRGNIES